MLIPQRTVIDELARLRAENQALRHQIAAAATQVTSSTLACSLARGCGKLGQLDASFPLQSLRHLERQAL